MDEFNHLLALLEERGIEYSLITQTCVSFDNQTGECVALPSTIEAGKLFVCYQIKSYCDTADELLDICGV